MAQLAARTNTRTPFKNGIPGKDWVEGFRKSHSDVTLRVTVPLTNIRARMLNPLVTKRYFDDLSKVVVSTNNPDIIVTSATSPPQVFESIQSAPSTQTLFFDSISIHHLPSTAESITQSNNNRLYVETSSCNVPELATSLDMGSMIQEPNVTDQAKSTIGTINSVHEILGEADSSGFLFLEGTAAVDVLNSIISGNISVESTTEF
ncbi:hypothetical protein KUTeg_024417 [Tegillarca granosa]|uniref:Uncharacterized protein n=1 Tax=Tegillarca granosa TaxID=220873 RepID=A0ABQ9E0C4_TEGGR|nr:hypothetical protein KUTeg_024417 [Tegillarca granosa]